jgi:hypothetical protein
MLDTRSFLCDTLRRPRSELRGLDHVAEKAPPHGLLGRRARNPLKVRELPIANTQRYDSLRDEVHHA